ncbi:hypothetical protein [Sphingomonas sp. CL5.1]|nr:hypothetical protein [Sphingomonas sp. CL5.1]
MSRFYHFPRGLVSRIGLLSPARDRSSMSRQADRLRLNKGEK